MTRTFAGSLSRKALAATLAAALTLTAASTAPARADGNGDAIAAAAFFGLIAAAIIASTRNDAGHPAPLPYPPVVTPRKVLPTACRFEIHHGTDRGTWFGRNCLVANYDYWQLLPDRCERRVAYPGRRHELVAYDARCLAQVGYRSDEGGRGVHH